MAFRVPRPSITALGVAAAALIVASPARAQSSLETTIRQYSATSVEGYIQPLADVLVSNLSSGFQNGAPLRARFSLGFEVVGTLAALDDQLKTYTATLPAGFQPATASMPTIFGGKATAVPHQSIAGLSYRGSDGLVEGDFFPGAVPQLRVGFANTEVVGRYFTSSIASGIPEEDFPELKIMGLGVRTSLSRLFGMLPFELSVGASYNTLRFGDIVELTSNSVGVQAGKDFGVLGLYGGISSDAGTMNLTYTSTDPQAPGTVDVDFDVARAMRFTGGAALRLGGFKLFGDANLGDVTTFSFGFRLGS